MQMFMLYPEEFEELKNTGKVTIYKEMKPYWTTRISNWFEKVKETGSTNIEAWRVAHPEIKLKAKITKIETVFEDDGSGKYDKMFVIYFKLS